MTVKIDSDVPFRKKPLDALADRMARDVIAGIYPNARKAATANIVEYARSEAIDEVQPNSRIGNFSAKIVKTLLKLGFDKAGKPVVF